MLTIYSVNHPHLSYIYTEDVELLAPHPCSKALVNLQ